MTVEWITRPGSLHFTCERCHGSVLGVLEITKGPYRRLTDFMWRCPDQACPFCGHTFRDCR